MPASATAAAIADGRQLRRVVLDVQPLAHDVGRELLEARQVLEAPLESATSSRQSIPSTLKVDSACSSQTVQVTARTHLVACSRPGGVRGRALLHVLEALLEQADDVLVVERVEDHAPARRGADEAHAAEQPQLMGDGRFAQTEQSREVADAQLGPRERVEDPDAGGVAQDLEGLGQRGDRRRSSSSGSVCRPCLNI